MTPSELKHHHNAAEVDCFFFSRDSMKHFGDSMKNYGVRSAVISVNYSEDGEYLHGVTVNVNVWELYRKRPVKHGVTTSAFFSKSTFKILHGDLI